MEKQENVFMQNKNFKKNEGPVISFRDIENSSNKNQSDPNIEMNESGNHSNSIGKMSNSNFRNN